MELHKVCIVLLLELTVCYLLTILDFVVSFINLFRVAIMWVIRESVLITADLKILQISLIRTGLVVR